MRSESDGIDRHRSVVKGGDFSDRAAKRAKTSMTRSCESSPELHRPYELPNPQLHVPHPLPDSDQSQLSSTNHTSNVHHLES